MDSFDKVDVLFQKRLIQIYPTTIFENTPAIPGKHI